MEAQGLRPKFGLLRISSTPKVCKIMALMAGIMSLGLLVYIPLGFQVGIIHLIPATSVRDPISRLQNSVKGPYIAWILPPLSNSWVINIIWSYIARNRTPNIDCY